MKNFEAINKLINENFKLHNEFHSLYEKYSKDGDPETLHEIELLFDLMDINRQKIVELRK